jgi:NAD(P)-dependent dehydrogenase (short-subunit alcohol dehydrogenase family)
MSSTTSNTSTTTTGPFWTSLQDKVIVVTGATAGIGKAVATIFAQKGAKVVFTGRRADQGNELAKQIGATFVQADTTSEADLKALFELVKAKFGHVDLVFANAGVLLAGDSIAGFNVDNLRKQFELNVVGVINTFKFGLPLLSANGLLLANSSSVSVMSLPAFNGYTLSKAAVDSYVRSAAEELKATQQRVFSINPYVFDSEMSQGASGGHADGMAAQMNPSGKLGNPAFIAQLIEELATGKTVYATGTNISIDSNEHYPVAQILGKVAAAAAKRQ